MSKYDELADELLTQLKFVRQQRSEGKISHDSYESAILNILFYFTQLFKEVL